MIDAKTIEELRGLLAADTSTDWQTVRTDPAEGADVWWLCAKNSAGQEIELGSLQGGFPHPTREARARLIVAMRNAIPALLDRLEKAEGELAEAREDVRSLCRFILNEWGPDGALKATTFALEQRQSAKGGDANAAPDRDTNSKSATSPGVTAGASAGWQSIETGAMRNAVAVTEFSYQFEPIMSAITAALADDDIVLPLPAAPMTDDDMIEAMARAICDEPNQ